MGQEDNTEMQIYTPQVYHRSTGCITRTGETEAAVGAPGKDETLVLLQSLGAVSRCHSVTVSWCHGVTVSQRGAALASHSCGAAQFAEEPSPWFRVWLICSDELVLVKPLGSESNVSALNKNNTRKLPGGPENIYYLK